MEIRREKMETEWICCFVQCRKKGTPPRIAEREGGSLQDQFSFLKRHVLLTWPYMIMKGWISKDVHLNDAEPGGIKEKDQEKGSTNNVIEQKKNRHISKYQNLFLKSERPLVGTVALVTACPSISNHYHLHTHLASVCRHAYAYWHLRKTQTELSLAVAEIPQGSDRPWPPAAMFVSCLVEMKLSSTEYQSNMIMHVG